MFDFNNFIEILNNGSDSNALDVALDTLKELFHIGKIEIKSSSLDEVFEYTTNKKYSKDVFLTYYLNGYKFNFYKVDDGYSFTDEEVNDISTLLKLISLHHKNYILIKKAEEARFVNLLTNLPNNFGFQKKINDIKKVVNVSLYNSYFINIKGFGLVNKLFGSDAGNMAIKEYANKLLEFRENDEVVGHLGGDNFIAFIKRTRHDKFIDLVTMCPVVLTRDGISKTVNLIGVVGYTELSGDVDYNAIISNPSIACQYARNTKKIVVKQTPDLLEMINSVKTIERTFAEELKNGNFVVYYQPKFDIKSGKIIGVEALSRWISDGKIVPPGMFVPILEKNGEIIDLDLYVLENLCKDIHNFRNQGHRIVPASCNLSRRDFDDLELESKVINIIKKYNVKSEDIVIEVTETTNLEENERLAKFINTMHKNGILTAIDDFGTGYSSLSVLRDFRVNEIKIDRSFINRDVLTNSDEIIIGSIIDMAKRLNINVICEGVETKSQAEFLIKLGCMNAQGFLYSKPIPKEEFEEMLLRIGTIYE